MQALIAVASLFAKNRFPLFRVMLYGGLRAGLAQLVEHLICNQGAAGSNPAAGTIISMA